MKVANGLLGFLFVFSLSGCSLLDWAVIGDSVTTYGAIESGIGVEGNPVFNAVTDGKALSTAAAAAVASYGVVHGVKHFAPSACEPVVRGVTGAKLGAVANNLAVIAGATGNAPLLAGVGVAVFAYQHEANQQQAKRFCQE
jgi:hypothetical protein